MADNRDAIAMALQQQQQPVPAPVEPVAPDQQWVSHGRPVTRDASGRGYYTGGGMVGGNRASTSNLMKPNEVYSPTSGFQKWNYQAPPAPNVPGPRGPTPNEQNITAPVAPTPELGTTVSPTTGFQQVQGGFYGNGVGGNNGMGNIAAPPALTNTNPAASVLPPPAYKSGQWGTMGQTAIQPGIATPMGSKGIAATPPLGSPV